MNVIKRLIVVLAAVAVLMPSTVVVAGTAWGGSWYECYRWSDGNEGHMRCRTSGSGWPRLYYQKVDTFRDTRTGATRKVWGPLRSVDGTSWGSWSDVFSPWPYSSVLVASSYWITW